MQRGVYLALFKPTDVIVIFGQRGSGKSTLQKRIASAYPRCIVVDRLREHNDADFVTDDVNKFAEFLKLNLNTQRFKIVFQFDVGQDSDFVDDTFTEIMRLSYMWGKISRQNICVSIEEVHFYASPVSINQWLFESVLTGRHANMAIICSSQRPASVHKSLVSQASHVFVGQLFEKRDIEYLYQTIGESALKAAELQQYSFIHYSPGQRESKIIS